MAIFKYIIIRLNIFLEKKNGTVEEIQKTELKTCQKRSSGSFWEIIEVISRKKAFIQWVTIYCNLLNDLKKYQ